mgnify:CR=1 FL=1
MPAKYFIKTFGGQMNEYDAGKLADVLAAETGEESYISSDLARALGRAFSDYQRAALAA